jgi:pimeloyl-ACP methyl ester carboxylesterase
MEVANGKEQSIMRWIRFALVALFLFSITGGLTLGAAQATVAHAGATSFVKAACGFRLGAGMTEGKNVYCGYLVVPEERARPNGRTLRLAVAVFESSSAKRASAPLIFLQGGPGGPIVADLGSSINSNNVSKIVGNQDLILIDQRGNGLSNPFLGCNPMRDVMVSLVTGQPSPSQEEAAYLRAARLCFNTFNTAGIDLNAFNTRASAADIAALGPALGYKQVNVYGVSYGTLVALTMMNLFPATIRSVIIDAVLPNQTNAFTQVPISMSRVFSVLFAGCAQDAACNKAYPHLDRTFYTLVDRLNAHPAHIDATDPATGKTAKVVLTGDRLVNEVFQMLYVTANIPFIPQLISEAARGLYLYAAQRFYETLTDVISHGSAISEGTYNSVQCGEDAPFTSARAITAEIGRMPSALRSAAQASQIGLYNTCAQVWRVAVVPDLRAGVARRRGSGGAEAARSERNPHAGAQWRV